MSGRFPDAPVRLPVSAQRWEVLTFLHWAYPPEVVQRLLPSGLRVQQWEGRTWVGVSPFRMAGVRVPGLPAPPAWRSFPELNVRVYVRGPDGRDGIWFPMLLATPSTFVTAMRIAGIRYVRARAEVAAEGPVRTYVFDPVRRRPWHPSAVFRATVRLGQVLDDHERTALLESLTGRWGAYHERGPMLWRTPVQHEPWSLLEATADGDLTGPLTAVSLPAPDEPPVVHAARTVHARIGAPRPLAVTRARTSVGRTRPSRAAPPA